MAKKGIKIKALAYELGITSRQLIERCRQEGIFAQNSLTKLDSAAEARMRALFSTRSGDSTGNSSLSHEDR